MSLIVTDDRVTRERPPEQAMPAINIKKSKLRSISDTGQPSKNRENKKDIGEK